MSTYGHTRENMAFAYSMGARQLIVAVNKMDTTVPAYSEDRFREIERQMSAYAATVGYDPKSVPVVPVAAFLGENMLAKSGNMPWFREWTIERNGVSIKGATLVNALDAMLPPVRPLDKPLRVPVQDVYKFRGVGTVVVDNVHTGSVSLGMVLTFSAPFPLKSDVKSLQMYSTDIPKAVAGDKNVYIGVPSVYYRNLKTGMVAGDDKIDPPKLVTSFKAHMYILAHPGEIVAGYAPVVKCHTALVACKFEKLLVKFDPLTGRKLEDNPSVLRSGDVALVKFVPLTPMSVEVAADYRTLGIFSVRDNRRDVAIGVITEVTNLEENVESSGNKKP